MKNLPPNVVVYIIDRGQAISHVDHFDNYPFFFDLYPLKMRISGEKALMKISVIFF
jgi:hypothetical protein